MADPANSEIEQIVEIFTTEAAIAGVSLADFRWGMREGYVQKLLQSLVLRKPILIGPILATPLNGRAKLVSVTIDAKRTSLVLVAFQSETDPIIKMGRFHEIRKWKDNIATFETTSLKELKALHAQVPDLDVQVGLSGSLDVSATQGVSSGGVQKAFVAHWGSPGSGPFFELPADKIGERADYYLFKLK